MSVYSTKDCSHSFLYYFIMLNPMSAFWKLIYLYVGNSSAAWCCVHWPHHFSASVINLDLQHVQSAISTVLSSSPGCVLAAHHTGSHYFLVGICPKWKIVWYLDSLRPRNDDDSLEERDYTSIKAVIDRYISELSYLQSTHLEPVTYLISI